MWWRRISSLRPRGHVKKRLIALFCAPSALWFLLLALDPPPDPYAKKPASIQVLARDGSLLRAFRSPDGAWRLRTDSHARNARLERAVIHHEDRWFRRHPGVNPLAVARAAWSNARAGRVVSGASTLTMQLARIVEPGERSIASKLRQVYRALQYECVLSKDEILTAYLDLAPFGGNIEGVEAASWIYFGKPSSAASGAEAALLAILPQSPTRRNPALHPDAAREARDALLGKLRRAGALDDATLALALAEPVPRTRRPMPFDAPHFAEWISRNGTPDSKGVLKTTLQPEIETVVEVLLRDHVRSLHGAGIGQGAVVVLDARTSEILAMAGSADYFDLVREGQVNGAVAPRSPGSTLKPFLYALAFDRGVTTPDRLLEDVPLHLGLYEPENYDRLHLGAIKASEALRTSRNVPAVWLAQELARSGGNGLYEFLKAACVRSVNQPRGHYGHALVLGGGEISLLDLANLYATLARHGRHLPATARPVETSEAGPRLFTPESAALVLDVLARVTRPDLDAVWRSGRRQVPVAWKTGTSFGHRDAWTVGVAGRFVVGVWIGNFDGRGVPHLVGVDTAAPLFFRIVDALPHMDDAGTWTERPRGLALNTLCSVSGAPLGPSCDYATLGWVVPGVSSAEPCRVHREISVDTETGFAVCSRCWTDGRHTARVVEWWPNDVARFLKERRVPAGWVPPHNPLCRALEPGSPPRIVQPQEDVEYVIRPGVPLEDQQIALSASVTRGTSEVYWFVNGSLFWKGPPAEAVFLAPVPGVHRVVVKDDAGRSASRTVRVRSL